MSRRKQARPSRLQDDEEEQENIKPNNCNNIQDINRNQSDIDKCSIKDGNENGESKLLEDANNNESNDPSTTGQAEKDEDETEKATAQALQNLLANLQWPTASPNTITLESLQNTKIAMAQFAANALTAGAVQGDNIQDLAVNLSTTLFTLQQQQLLQLQLIQQLQNQLHVSNSDQNSENEEEEEEFEGEEEVASSPRKDSSPVAALAVAVDDLHKSNTEIKSPEANKGLTTSLRNSNLTSSDGLNPAFASLLNCANQDPNRPLSPGLPPNHQEYSQQQEPIDEQPNTLEMLQKRAQEVLDSASQGLLASSLADDPRKKLGPYEKGREPFFKHRCRYCGKVFGSDSALQIHIRSHTGERPFKCNVCGSRFTTKGNLKVHFQRHTSKFPHVKMNPHPVPEHLDAFHPPLLSGSNSGGASSPENSPPHNSSSLPNFLTGLPGGPPQPPPPSFHPFSPLFRFDLKPPQPPNFHPEPAAPQDLTKPKINKESEEEINEMQSEEEEQKEDLKIEVNGVNSDLDEDEINSMQEDTSQDQPENLSSKSLPLMYPLPLMVHPPRPSSSSTTSHHPHHRPMVRSPSPISPRNPELPPHHNNINHNHNQFDPAKDPAIYTNLLPRPGSNDNAWESLIEVTKTSETSKLQQLVDNIEHKMTDPNQCIICHRVLSCKSALQMHYRTHTGERPFKCKICGRAFTTKGNLKTHMGVHRAKPPLRVLHQCPVCHKRFTNSLVLQQHIRLHTGEPTDLTPDQIRAAEVRDPYPSFPGFPPYGNFFPPGHPNYAHHPSSILSNDDQQSIIKSELDDLEDDLDDDLCENNCDDEEEESQSPIATENEKPTSLAALENQVRTITTSFATQMLTQNNKPNTEVSLDLTQKNGKPEVTNDDSSNSSTDWKHSVHTSPIPTSTNNFAPLDLTPRNNIFNPFLLHQPHLVHQSLITPTLNSIANSVLNSNFNLVPPPPPSHHTVPNPRQFSEAESFLWTSRGNTTCQICLKTFACNSALEIHYRSHTKERPFKCGVCSRGFSTKGNMKQHMLTHKIRDVGCSSNHSFDSSNSKPNNGNNNSDDDLSSPETPSSPPPVSVAITGDTTPKRSPSPIPIPNNKSDEDSMEPPPAKKPKDNSPPPSPIINHQQTGLSSEDGDREPQCAPSGQHSANSKHICKVCTKNFSSSSALHIHSRTHTGDRPFKCNVCQKAFTTKGNLKVHMGTHMWTSGVSRRGRRMSLDPLSVFLPLPGAPNPHPLQQQQMKKEIRPPTTAELFYPYAQTLAAPIFHPNGSLNISERSKRFGSLSKLENLVLDEERKIIRSESSPPPPPSKA